MPRRTRKATAPAKDPLRDEVAALICADPDWAGSDTSAEGLVQAVCELFAKGLDLPARKVSEIDRRLHEEADNLRKPVTVYVVVLVVLIGRFRA